VGRQRGALGTHSRPHAAAQRCPHPAIPHPPDPELWHLQSFIHCLIVRPGTCSAAVSVTSKVKRPRRHITSRHAWWAIRLITEPASTPWVAVARALLHTCAAEMSSHPLGLLLWPADAPIPGCAAPLPEPLRHLHTAVVLPPPSHRRRTPATPSSPPSTTPTPPPLESYERIDPKPRM